MSELKQHVLDHLNITWELDEQESRYVDRMIADAQEYFIERTGVDLDFTKGQPRSLLLNRVLYDRNHKLEWFENNYQNEISELLVRYAANKEGELDGDY